MCDAERGAGRVPSAKAFAGIIGIAVAVTLAVGFALRLRPESPGERVTSVVRRVDRFVGQRLTLTGRLEEVVSAKSFTLTDGVERILVLDVSVVPAVDTDLDGVLTDERVEVTGVVRIFAIEEAESYVGELIDERYEAFVGEPVIVADAITPRWRRSEPPARNSTP